MYCVVYYLLQTFLAIPLLEVIKYKVVLWLKYLLCNPLGQCIRLAKWSSCEAKVWGGCRITLGSMVRQFNYFYCTLKTTGFLN